MSGKKDERKFPATVVSVLDSEKIVINRGSDHGIKQYQRFLIYALSKDEIKDPDTGDSLGRLEIVKGTGQVIHVQPKMSTIKTDMKKPSKKTITRSTSSFIFGPPRNDQEVIEPSTEYVPFEDPKVGDMAKPI